MARQDAEDGYGAGHRPPEADAARYAPNPAPEQHQQYPQTSPELNTRPRAYPAPSNPDSAAGYGGDYGTGRSGGAAGSAGSAYPAGHAPGSPYPAAQAAYQGGQAYPGGTAYPAGAAYPGGSGYPNQSAQYPAQQASGAYPAAAPYGTQHSSQSQYSDQARAYGAPARDVRDQSAVSQSAAEQRVYGHSAYGQAANGQSAPGPSAFGQSGMPTAYPPAAAAYPGQSAYPASWYGQPAAPEHRRSLRTVFGIIGAAVLAVAGGILIALPRGGAAAHASTGVAAQDQNLRAAWRSIPANQLLPPTLTREGTEAYVRVGIDPAESCSVLPAKFVAALKPASCARVISATYIDRAQEVTATVGIVVTAGPPDVRQDLYRTWTADSYATQYAMMPHAYTVPGTAAANFGDAQRVAWESQISTDGTYIVYAVAGFSDGRAGSSAAALAAGAGSALNNDSPPVEVAGDLPSAIQNILSAKENTVSGGSA